MVVNLTSPTPQLTVASYDVTPCLVSAQLSYAPWSPGQGIIVATGEFTLRESRDVPESLDPTRNPRFTFGKRVELSLDGATAPIAGVSCIDSSTWDGKELIITTSCLLGLYNSVGPGGLGVCVDLNENASLSSVIKYLLTRAGISDVILGNISGNIGIMEPINIPPGSSFVGLASQLAASNGYVLYCRNSGTVTSGDITGMLNKPVAFNKATYELADYGRIGSQSLPMGALKVSGSVSDKFLTDTYRVSTITSQTQNGFDTTIKNTSIDFKARIIEHKSETLSPIGDIIGDGNVLFPGGQVIREESSTKEYYEGGSSGVTQPSFSGTNANFLGSEDCLEKDEARLYRRATLSRQNSRLLLKAWNEIGIKQGTIDPETLGTGSVADSVKTVENISYNLPELKPIEVSNAGALTGVGIGQVTTRDSDGNYSVTYSRRQYRALGAEFPYFAKFADTFLLPALELYLVEKEDTKWNLDSNLNQWSKERTVYKTRYSQYPEEIQALASNQGPEVAFSSARAMIAVLRETQEGSAPADFGRMPPIAQVQKKPFTATYRMNGAYERFKTVSLGDFTGTVQDALPIAEAFGRWENGQLNNHRIVVPTNGILGQASSFCPALNTCVVFDPLLDTVFHFAIQSPSLLIQANESVMTVTGVLLGSQGANPVDPPTGPVPGTDISGPDVGTLEPIPPGGDDSVFPRNPNDPGGPGVSVNPGDITPGGEYPNIKDKYGRGSGGGGSDGQSFPDGWSGGGGFTWVRPSPEGIGFPLVGPGDDPDFGPGEQEFLNPGSGGGSSSGGSGSGGNVDSSGGLVGPGGRGTEQPIDEWGSPGSGSGSGSGFGSAGGGSGVGGSGGGGGGSSPGYNTGDGSNGGQEHEFMYWALFTDFPKFSSVLEDGSTLLLDALNGSEEYMQGKLSPLISLQ
jgi:hypothetical protein